MHIQLTFTQAQAQLETHRSEFFLTDDSHQSPHDDHVTYTHKYAFIHTHRHTYAYIFDRMTQQRLRFRAHHTQYHNMHHASQNLFQSCTNRSRECFSRSHDRGQRPTMPSDIHLVLCNHNVQRHSQAVGARF